MGTTVREKNSRRVEDVHESEKECSVRMFILKDIKRCSCWPILSHRCYDHSYPPSQPPPAVRLIEPPKTLTTLISSS